MQRYASAFSRAASRLSTAATKTAREYAEQSIPDEVTFTGALAARLRDAIDGSSISGIHWRAKVLNPKTEEPTFGADFLGVLTLGLPDLSVAKGFLAQSKRQEPGRKLAQREWDELSRQCDRMLRYSSESYVFVYAMNGIAVVSALSVSECTQREDLHTLQPKTISTFYGEHFRCFIGDRAINQPTPRVLDDLMARAGLAIAGSLEPQQRIFSE